VAEGGPAELSHIESLGRGTVVMVVGTILLFLLSFIGRVAVARHLSVEDFGDFNLGLALAGLLSLVALLGLHQAVARTLAENKDPAARRRVIRWAASITVVTALASTLLVYLLANPIANLFDPAGSAQLTIVFQMFSVTIGLTLLCTFIASVFQGFEDTLPNAWINQAVQPGAFVVFVYIFIAYHLNLYDALLSWVISNVVTFAVLVVYAWLRLGRHLPPGPVAKDLPGGMLILSLSLWGVTTLAYVTAFVDTLILGVFRPESAVGIYSAVMTLARLLLAASAAVTYIFLPVAARLTGEGDIESIRSSYVTTSRWVLLFTVPMFFVFGLLPGNSVTFVFGAPYSTGALSLAVVTVGALISVAFGPVNVTLAGMGNVRPLLFATAVSATANVVLSFALIPTYGLIGAAVAWSVARVLYPATAALSLYLASHIHPLRRTFVYPLTLSLGVGIPLFLFIGILPHPAWIVVPLYFVGVGIFLGALLVTRSVEVGDMVLVRILEGLFRRPLPGLERFLLRFCRDPTPAVSPLLGGLRGP
jgi:O-antigen/teichoic acid export membrane protein